MKKIFFVAGFTLIACFAKAQTTSAGDSSLSYGRVNVIKDARIELLAKKQADFNESAALGPRSAKGYRLMVLSTNDRTQAMNLRAKLLQRFPEQKVYMSFQPPYIKLKFGNFLEKSEADDYKKDILSSKMVSTNIYLVPEIIEVKPDKSRDKDSL